MSGREQESDSKLGGQSTTAEPPNPLIYRWDLKDPEETYLSIMANIDVMEKKYCAALVTVTLRVAIAPFIHTTTSLLRDSKTARLLSEALAQAAAIVDSFDGPIEDIRKVPRRWR